MKQHNFQILDQDPLKELYFYNKFQLIPTIFIFFLVSIRI